MTITVLLADDHTILRQGLRALLNETADIKVLGEAGNGIEALRLVEQLHPDVLVLDVTMPEMNGLEVCYQVRKAHPDTRVIMLSMHAREAYVVEAIKNGAQAYVLKDSQAEHLVQAVRSVMTGRRFLSPSLEQHALDAYFDRAFQAATDHYDLLTNREREVFKLVAEGFTSQEIANKLSLSVRTIDVHRARLMDKLNLRTQTDLVRLAIKKGVISVE